MRGELAWGWLTHYAVGVAFAVVLLSLQGAAWVHSPTLLPALAVGMGTVAAPLLVMQPAMGSGFAASRTPTRSRTACAASPTTPCLAWACISPRWSSH